MSTLRQQRRARPPKSPLTQLTGLEQIDLFNYYINTTMGKTPTDKQKAAYEKFSSASGGSGDAVLPSISAKEGVEPVSGAIQVTTPSETTEDPPKPEPTPAKPSPKSPQPSPTTDPIGDILERLKAERAARKLGDIGEGQFALERTPGDELQPLEKQMQTMMGEAEPGGPEDAPAMATLRSRDEEIAAREPLGESAGRLAIQNFMERNFGFRPTVTFDVEEQEPGGTGSLF